MALTTKRFNTPITLSISYSNASTLNSSFFPGGSASTITSSSSFIRIVSSSHGSTIYTVPAGRTAKVFFDKLGYLSFSRTQSFSVSGVISGPVSYYDGYYYMGTELGLGIFYNSYYCDSIFSNILSFGSVTSLSYNNISVVAASGSNSRLVTDFRNSNSSLSYSLISDSLRGGLPFIFLGPNQTLGVSLLASDQVSESHFFAISASGGPGYFSVSTNRNVSAILTAYLGFTVIEELGS